jgi:hypothetical protein
MAEALHAVASLLKRATRWRHLDRWRAKERVLRGERTVLGGRRSGRTCPLAIDQKGWPVTIVKDGAGKHSLERR